MIAMSQKRSCRNGVRFLDDACVPTDQGRHNSRASGMRCPDQDHQELEEPLQVLLAIASNVSPGRALFSDQRQ